MADAYILDVGALSDGTFAESGWSRSYGSVDFEVAGGELVCPTSEAIYEYDLGAGGDTGWFRATYRIKQDTPMLILASDGGFTSSTQGPFANISGGHWRVFDNGSNHNVTPTVGLVAGDLWIVEIILDSGTTTFRAKPYGDLDWDCEDSWTTGTLEGTKVGIFLNSGTDALLRLEYNPDPAFVPPDYYATLTVPSGAVASDLTDFVVRVDLADLPSGWWNDCDGGNIRVRNSSDAIIPFDVVSIDTGAQTGELFFKSTLNTGSDNVFTIWVEHGATPLPADDANGRNEVWGDYDFMCHFSEWVDRTGAGNDPVAVGALITYYTLSREVNSTAFQQGAAWDGTYWYATGGTNNLRVEKFNAAGTSQASVANLSTATSIPFTHISGCCVKGGELYISVEDGDAEGVNQKVIVLNLSDLSYNRQYDISGHGEMSDICWNSDNSVFACSDYHDPTRIHTFDATFSTYAMLTLPSGIGAAQGIEWSGGYYFIMSGPGSGASYLYRVADDMSGSLEGRWSGSEHCQGLCAKTQTSGTPDLYHASDDGDLDKLTYASPSGSPDPAWLTLGGGGNAQVSLLPKRTQWSMGATVRAAAVPSSHRTVLSYSHNGGTNGNRASLSIQSNARWGMWNSSDGQVYGTTMVSGDIDQRRRAHHIYNGTSARYMYLQGVLDGSDTTVAQRPAGGSDGTMALFIGAEDTDVTERWNGAINYVYLRNGVLSADWIAAEFDSWEDPSNFYDILDQPPEIELAGEVPGVTSSLELAVPAIVTLGGAVPGVTSVINLAPILDVTLAGAVPVVGADFDVTVESSAYAEYVLSLIIDPFSSTPLSPEGYWRMHDRATTKLSSPTGYHQSLALVDCTGFERNGLATGVDWTNNLNTYPNLIQPADGNNAMRFDGLHAVVDDADIRDLLEWTIAFWLTPAPATDVTDQQEVVVGRANSFSDTEAPWGLFNDLGDLKVRVKNDADELVVVNVSDFVPELSTSPLFIAFGWDQHFVYVWLNGALIATEALEEPGLTSDRNLRIGGDGWIVDEVAVFGYILDDLGEDVIQGMYLLGGSWDVILDGAVPPVTGSFDGYLSPMLTLAGTVPPVTGSFDLPEPLPVTLAGSVPPVAGSFVVQVDPQVTLAGSVPPVTSSLVLSHGRAITLAGAVPPIQANVQIALLNSIALAGAVPAVTSDFVILGAGADLTLDGAVPGVTSTLSLQGVLDVVLGGSVPAVGGSFVLDVDVEVASLTSTGSGVLTLSDAIVVDPELGLAIQDPVVQRAPSSIVARVSGGQPLTAISLFIDGTEVISGVTDSDGAWGLSSIPVSEALGPVGVRTLTAEQVVLSGATIVASATFEVLYEPIAWPATPGTNPPPTLPPGAIVVGTDVQRWVLQDPAPGGLGSYIFPQNPREMASPHFERAVSSRHTTAGKDGQFHVYEAAGRPKEWSFSGYAPTEEMCDKLLAYRDLNKRFYLIDHRNRAWQVVFTVVDIVPRLRHIYNGVETDWGSDYTVSATILNQTWSTPT